MGRTACLLYEDVWDRLSYFSVDSRAFKRKSYPSNLASLMLDFLSVPVGLRGCGALLFVGPRLRTPSPRHGGISWLVPGSPEGLHVSFPTKSGLAEQVPELHPLVLRVLARTSQEPFLRK